MIPYLVCEFEKPTLSNLVKEPPAKVADKLVDHLVGKSTASVGFFLTSVLKAMREVYGDNIAAIIVGTDTNAKLDKIELVFKAGEYFRSLVLKYDGVFWRAEMGLVFDTIVLGDEEKRVNWDDLLDKILKDNSSCIQARKPERKSSPFDNKVTAAA